MVAYSFYDSDNRVRRYAETLARRGDHVDAISLRKEGQKSFDTINGVNVFRIQERKRNEKGRLSYLGRLLRFLIKSAVFMSRKHLKQPYDLIHIHSVPDFEVFAACLPKLLGAKIILDIHDIVPEFYASKFGGGRDSMLFKGLLFLEKASARFADHVIISNHIWERTLVSRSVKQAKCSTVLNYPDSSLFHPRQRDENNGKIVMIYPGTLNWHQGVDIALRAFSIVSRQAPNAEFHIWGDGDEKANLQRLVHQLGLDDRVFFKGHVGLDQIADVMGNADLGLVPKRDDAFGGEAFSTKILEFMALGIPVIVSRTKIDNYYFNDSVVQFFRAGDETDLAESMLLLLRDTDRREYLVANASQFMEGFTWDSRKEEYLKLVESLTAHPDH